MSSDSIQRVCRHGAASTAPVSLSWCPDCQQSTWKPPPADQIGWRSKRFRRTASFSRSALLTPEPWLLQISQLFRTIHLCSRTEKLDPEGNWTFGKQIKKASPLKWLIRLCPAYSVQVYGVRLVPATVCFSTFPPIWGKRNKTEKTMNQLKLFTMNSALVFSESNLS